MTACFRWVSFVKITKMRKWAEILVPKLYRKTDKVRSQFCILVPTARLYMTDAVTYKYAQFTLTRMIK